MATEPKPLTDEQVKQRDDLNKQAAAYEAAQAEKARKDRKLALAPVEDILKALNDCKVVSSIDTAIDDAKIDFSTKARLQSMKAAITYNADQLTALLASVTDPVVIPSSTPTETA